jgi:UDP-galactopyranose mutase
MIQGLGLVVFSHLRWNFVYQRPQHLLSRIARSVPVLFIEEPVHDPACEPYFEITSPQDGVLVARFHSPLAVGGFDDAQMALMRPLIGKLLADRNFTRYCTWFYTPMALPLLNDLQPELVVYDCMDALDAFLHAPPKLKEREAALLEKADLVFTGGPSLFRRLQGRHAHAHCFSSSVDATHYARAKGDTTDPADQAELGKPRLGYFGVIDERIDLQLIEVLATAHPEWQIVMVGPVVKISEAALPRRGNLHYLGQKEYANLPEYLGGWDVCLLPFARNESTRFISPTKTLEYMAAERPIVSTPITDVAEPYGEIVYLADTPAEFVARCEQALQESPAERERRFGLMRKVLASTSWDNTVNRMLTLMDQALQHKSTSPPPGDASQRALPHASGARAVGATSSRLRPPSPPVVIVGSGPTGLSAAYHLGEESLLLEQHERTGGWCRSVEEKGFTFDYAGHIMFSNDPYVHKLYEMLLGDNVHWQNREAWVYSKEVYTRYPFQGALYGLPPEVIKECIMGAIEARYGTLKPEAGSSCASNGHSGAHTNGNANGHHAADGPSNGKVSGVQVIKHGDVKDCCADGVLESTAPLVKQNGHANGASHNGAPRNFEEFIYKVWGAGIAKHFAIPYNRKLWAVPLAEMETSWLGGRVPLPDLEEMIEGALQPVGKPMGPNARFGYPLRGGFQALMDGFLPHLKGTVRPNSQVVAVSPQHHSLLLKDGTSIAYEQLISTMPLPTLIRLLGEEAPEEVRAAAKKLRHVSVRCVNLGIGRENLTDKHWIYYPEETVFHRIFVQGNASPHCNPPGGFGLTCEITYSPHKPLPCDGDELIERCIEDCRSVGIIRKDDPVWVANQIDMPYAYVVYDHARQANVTLIRQWLREHDILLAGRYSEWEYYNSDHAFLAGKKAADTVQALRTGNAATGRPRVPTDALVAQN